MDPLVVQLSILSSTSRPRARPRIASSTFSLPELSRCWPPPGLDISFWTSRRPRRSFSAQTARHTRTRDRNGAAKNFVPINSNSKIRYIGALFIGDLNNFGGLIETQQTHFVLDSSRPNCREVLTANWDWQIQCNWIKLNK
jgi:hypothetical protein